jgi:hypothetical protein
MSDSARAASKRSITITVPPLRIVPSDQPIGAPWYSGPVQRKTVSGEKPNMFFIVWSMLRPVPNGRPVVAGRMPLGCPVVPDE